ncbi:MAG: sulfotransferase [Sphingomonadales bacterium]|nr:sulfotransferase [Sphingomonadales bacterium]
MQFESNYSWLDRLLHRLAFATPQLQIDFAESEDRKFADLPLQPPLFITGLPRAGTTLLLNCLAGLEEFAAHSYRDMPFVLVPQLWSRVSMGFQKPEERMERAHGDGMTVGSNSPEALEEMLWLAFFPRRYAGDRITPWPDSADLGNFKLFFANHMRKIAALRRPGMQARYVSKNNLNISRISVLFNAFPDADIVVPFRSPLQHAASLLRQHRNFLELHARDAFAKAYMAGVGHFDFGANLKPVDFGDWLEHSEHRDPMAIEFWLAYWISTYRHILDRHSERMILVSHDKLCAEPLPQLQRLAGRLRLSETESFVAQAAGIKGASPHVDQAGISGALLAESLALMERLDAAACG